MKKFIILSLICISMITSSSVMAQKTKIGHINLTELLQAMPQYDSIYNQLQKISDNYNKTFMGLQTELENKIQDYQANESSYEDLIKQAKQAHIQDLQNRMMEFRQNAEANIQKKEKELTDPLVDTAKKAVDAVAKDNGYSYVLDSSLGIILFSEESDNLLPLVKKKLGII